MTSVALAEVQPQELAITILGNELLHRPASTSAWSGGLVAILDGFGFSEEAARAALSRLVRRGLLRRVRAGRRVSYALTERCRHALSSGERRILAFGCDRRPWDGRWTVVAYGLGDERRAVRDRLRARLAFLGFGPLRDGVWIAPEDRSGPLAEVLEELGVADLAEVFVGCPAAATHPARLLARAWDLEGLERAYAHFATSLDGLDLAACAGIDAVVARAALMHRYRTLIAADPELPGALLPPGSARPGVVEAFGRAWRTLAPAAASAFDALCRVEEEFG